MRLPRSRPSTRPTAVACAAVVVLSLSACGADSSSEASPADSPTPISTDTSASTSGSVSTTQTEPTETTETTDPDAVVVEITEQDGQIAADPQIVEAERGQEILLSVDSDAEDEFHLHSEPEQSFEVQTADDQEFAFSIDNGGQYELESHELDILIVKIQVR